jgi:hypothetical protein
VAELAIDFGNEIKKINEKNGINLVAKTCFGTGKIFAGISGIKVTLPKYFSAEY